MKRGSPPCTSRFPREWQISLYEEAYLKSHILIESHIDRALAPSIFGAPQKSWASYPLGQDVAQHQEQEQQPGLLKRRAKQRAWSLASSHFTVFCKEVSVVNGETINHSHTFTWSQQLTSSACVGTVERNGDQEKTHTGAGQTPKSNAIKVLPECQIVFQCSVSHHIKICKKLTKVLFHPYIWNFHLVPTSTYWTSTLLVQNIRLHCKLERITLYVVQSIKV